MVLEEKLRKSKELLEINRKKLEAAQVTLSEKITLLEQYKSQLNQGNKVLDKSKISQPINTPPNQKPSQTPNIRTTPLLTPEATYFLENFLKQKPDANVLEFGSGGSTIWISKLTKKLVSIEHDTKWYKKVKNNLQQDATCNSVDLRLLSRPYHTVCDKFPQEFFDLIIVDGRDRVKCIEASIKVLRKGGILMVDDAQRDKYKPGYELLKDWLVTRTLSKPRHTYWWEKPFQKITSVEKKQSIPKQKPTVQELEKSQVLPGVSMVKDQSENILVKISSVKIFKPDTNLLHGYYLDRPKKGEIFNQHIIKLVGWVIGKNSSVVGVEIISNGQVIKTVSINKQRFGVAKAYPQIAQAKTSGFATEINVIDLPKASELRLQAVLKDKNQVLLAVIKLNLKSDKSIGVIDIAT